MKPRHDTTITITIAGAGLAGALLAALLARAGWRVEVFEKRADPRQVGYEGGRSINLALAERGLHALRQAGLHEAVLAQAVMMRGRMVHFADGHTALQRYGKDDSEVIWSVHRGRLNLLLLDAAEAAGAKLHFHARLDGVDFTAKKARFSDDRDGSVNTHAFDVLIGADGAGSALRGAMGAMTPLGERFESLGHGYKELEIPPAVDGGFRIEPNALHIWPRGRYMCIALPNTERTFTVTLFLPQHAADGAPGFDTLPDVAAARALFAHDFPHALAQIPQFDADWSAHPIGQLSTLYLDHWHLDGRAVLLGDAAHAMVPFHGQGMNCAFEDCVALARHIADAADFATAFAAFQAERLPNARAIQQMALENYLEMRDRVDDADYLLQRDLERLLAQRHPGRFVPRYAMVTFLRVPYATAFARGRVQRELLIEATRGCARVEEVNLDATDALVRARLPPLDALSFLWFDLETFGKDHLRSRIAQFAAQRTDKDLNPIGEPLVLHCQPADDLLPSPEATLVTGITPQDARRDGLREAEFVNRMMDELARPNTCAVGFNSLRFDDEFVRVSAYRNFHDPYAREWKDGNSRWDLLDVLRLAHALRPDGIVWPQRRDGMTSFKLTDLTAANGIGHEHAHDALADVQATLGMARLLKRAQPRLFDYALTLRDKRRVAGLLDIAGMAPILHISSKFPAARRNAALVAPICPHPTMKTQVIAFDLSADPQPLLDLDADDIADRLYTPAADLPEGVARIPLKAIHLNRCPMLVELKTLRDPDIERLHLDLAMAQRRAQQLRDAPGLVEKVRRVFARADRQTRTDADAALYDRLIPNRDLALFTQIRNAAPADLPAFANQLQDPRLQELLLRYQARNWPESLDAAQRERWDAHRRQRLECDVGLSEYSFETYAASIARLRVERADDGPAQALLDQLDAWGRELRTSLS